MRVADNLAGTRNLAELVDAPTRDAAANGRLDFAGAVETAIERLAAADLTTTITTLQGPILLRDYLVSRCVEAVVHGVDLMGPVEPDRAALELVADALTGLLAARDPDLVAIAAPLPRATWVAIATGRERAPASLRGVVPLMA